MGVCVAVIALEMSENRKMQKTQSQNMMIVAWRVRANLLSAHLFGDGADAVAAGLVAHRQARGVLFTHISRLHTYTQTQREPQNDSCM